MKKTLLCSFLLLSLAACTSSQPPAPRVESGLSLGAGDQLGRDLHRTDRAIASAVAQDRALAAHPDE